MTLSANREADESEPLLNEQRLSWRPLLFLLGIVTLERCTYYNYMSMAIGAGHRHIGQPYCGALLGESPTEPFGATLLSRVLPQGLSFLLTLVGGYVADNLIGCARTLAAGCFMYTLAALMLIGFVFCPAMCLAAMVTVGKFGTACGSGLIRPCLLVLTIESGKLLGLSVRRVCQLHYACEALSQLLGNLLAFGSDRLAFPLGFVTLPTSVIMLLLALLTAERPGWDPSQFELPGLPRFKRVVVTTAPLIALSASVLAGYFSLSVSDLNGDIRRMDANQFRWSHNLLLLCYSATLLAAVALLMLATRASALVRHLPDVRIAIGVAATALGHLTALIVSSSQLAGSFWLIAGGQNFLYAMGEAFAISTANEVAFRSGFTVSRAFMVGLFMGIWGSGYLFNEFLVHIATAVIAHWIASGAMLLTNAYLFFFAVPAMDWLLRDERS